MNQSEMTAKIEQGDGFIAALDQSGGSTPKALKGYGIEEGAWSSDEEMFDLIHQMRARIITSPCFAGGKVIGAILFERTMDGKVDGKPTPQALIDRGVVPFIKIDKGLEDEENGVQMMKPMPDLDALLDARQGARRVRHQGALGHQRARIAAGIAVLVAQQFQVAKQVLAHGMMPIIEPEVNIKSADRDAGDELLLDAILRSSTRFPRASRSCSSSRSRRRPGCSSRWSIIPRCCASSRLSGGFSREEACRELARNPGMIASFSRALLSDLRHRKSDEEFDRTLGGAIDEIHRGVDHKGASLTLDETEFDPLEFAPAATDGAGEALSDQPAGGRRKFSRPPKAALEPGVAAAFQLRVKDVPSMSWRGSPNRCSASAPTPM